MNDASCRNANSCNNIPLVSVVMCTHNAARTMTESVASILNQSFTDFELILYDDASTDATVATIEGFNDARIKIILGQVNLGPGGAAVQAIAAADGEYIARLDADDLALPERLQCQVDYLSQHPEVWLLGSNFIRFRGPPPVAAPSEDDSADSLAFEDLLKRNSICHSSVMFRRKILETGIGYRQAFRLAEDYDFFLRIALKGKVAVLRRCLCLHRHSPTSLSFMRAAEMRRNIEIVRSLAQERKNTGSDMLDKTGALPALTEEQEEQVRAGTIYTLLDTAHDSFREGYSLAAAQLVLRAFFFSPLRTLRAIAGMIKANR